MPEPVGISPDTSAPGIDWTAEARRAGAAVTNQPKAREFGHLPQGDAEKALPATPAHHAGEQYRDTLGATIVWVSDHCFVLSESSPLEVPQGLAPTTTVCPGDSDQPRGDLFKPLPAYDKVHPQQTPHTVWVLLDTFLDRGRLLQGPGSLNRERRTRSLLERVPRVKILTRSTKA